jgi:hypothetical protein
MVRIPACDVAAVARAHQVAGVKLAAALRHRHDVIDALRRGRAPFPDTLGCVARRASRPHACHRRDTAPATAASIRPRYGCSRAQRLFRAAGRTGAHAVDSGPW